MEIDSRAAQIAGLALAMCAREMDRRFFNRGVQADIAVLEPIVLEEDDIPDVYKRQCHLLVPLVVV